MMALNKVVSRQPVLNWYDDESESESSEEIICVETMRKRLLSQGSETTMDTCVMTEASSWSSPGANDEDDDCSEWSWYLEDKDTVVHFSELVDVLEYEPHADNPTDTDALFYSADDFEAFREEYIQELESQYEEGEQF